MNEITLTPQGIIVSEGVPVETRILMFLGSKVGLTQDFTLRGCFKLVEKHPVLMELSPFFETVVEQYDNCPAEGCVDSSLDGLILAKTIEMIGFPGIPRLEIYNSLFGLKGSETSEIRDFPLESILDMPLKLGRLKHVVFGDKVDLFEFEAVFTLFEFLDAIVWELSFQGKLLVCEIRR